MAAEQAGEAPGRAPLEGELDETPVQARPSILKKGASNSFKDKKQSGFFDQVTVQEAMEGEDTAISNCRLWAISVVDSKHFDLVMGLVIAFNIVLMVMEADVNARCVSLTTALNEEVGDCPAPVVKSMNLGLLGLYTVELAIRLYALRWLFFRNFWNDLDAMIVSLGYLDIGLAVITAGGGSRDSGLPPLQMLRIFRTLRLMRAVRLMRFFPELHVMIMGFFGAMRAMFWGLVMIMVLLVIWSLITVEMVHPLNHRLAMDTVNVVWDLNWCPYSLDSIWHSTLLLFQTLVAGDSWGLCIVPIIRVHPWTFWIFSLSLVSVALGFTNLILAVIVDKAAAAREEEHQSAIQSNKDKEAISLAKWLEVMQTIDADGNGTISLEELYDGYDTQESIQTALHNLDLGRGDLSVLFDLMVDPGQEAMSYQDLINCLQKAKALDMRVYLMHIQLQISRMERRIESDGQKTQLALKEILRRGAVVQAPKPESEAVQAGAAPAAPPEESAATHEAASAHWWQTGVFAPPPGGKDASRANVGAEVQKMHSEMLERFEAVTRQITLNTREVSRHTQAFEEVVTKGLRASAGAGASCEGSPAGASAAGLSAESVVLRLRLPADNGEAGQRGDPGVFQLHPGRQETGGSGTSDVRSATHNVHVV